MRKSALKFLIVLFSTSFNMVSGQKYIPVGEIRITGNHRTHGRIISRELTFKTGDTLALDDVGKMLERSRQNIFNTNLFIWAKVTGDITSDTLKVEIEVKERWYFMVLPLVFLADRNINEWWYDRNHDLRRITYGGIIKHFNLSGNNDQLRLKAYGGFVPYFELSYIKPYIDKRQRMGISGGVFFSTQRTMAFRTWNDKLDFHPTEVRSRRRAGGFAEYRLRNSLYHFHSLYVGFSHAKIADTIAALNPNYFGERQTTQRILTLSYDYRFDNRDNRQYPLKGRYFFGQLANYQIYTDKHSSQTSLVTGIGEYFKIRGKLYGDVMFRAKVSAPQRQFYPVTSGLGFNNNLVRGYELYVIDGQNYTLFKTNLKYQLLKHTFDLRKLIRIKQFNNLPVAVYPNAYYDMGYVRNYHPELSNTKLGNKWLKGGGLGLDIVTWYDTTIKFNYSVNQMKEKRFYFGIYRDL
jgi:outer membrane protein assembly factor BamA